MTVGCQGESDESVYVELDQRMCDADAEIAFRGQSHLFVVLAAEEISQTETQGTLSPNDLTIFSIVRRYCGCNRSTVSHYGGS